MEHMAHGPNWLAGTGYHAVIQRKGKEKLQGELEFLVVGTN